MKQHDEAFAEAFAALRFTRATENSARVLFDAGVAAERERCAKIADGHDTWRDNPANVIAEEIRKDDE